MPNHLPMNLQIFTNQYPRMITAILFAVLLSGCENSEQAATPPGMGMGGGMPVTVIEAQPEAVPHLINAVGQTEGSKDVEIRARVSGTLLQQHYTEGNWVQAGTVLFSIDPAPYEIAVAQAEAALAQDKANLEQARREAARLKPLVESNAISSRELDNANTALEAALASQQVNKALLRDAELNLSYTRVTAPISGITGRAQFSQGTLVSAGTTSSLLTTMRTVDPVWVRFSLSESESMQLRRNKDNRTVTLTLPDGSTYDTSGTINFTASSVDNSTGMVAMRAEFPNPETLLLPGQFVRVQISFGEREAYLIPHAALSQTDQGNMLFTVSPENTVAPKPVEVDGWFGQNWVVTQGLVPGDRVIIDNLMKMRPGSPVSPHAPGEMPGAPPGAAPEH